MCSRQISFSIQPKYFRFLAKVSYEIAVVWESIPECIKPAFKFSTCVIFVCTTITVALPWNFICYQEKDVLSRAHFTEVTCHGCWKCCWSFSILASWTSNVTFLSISLLKRYNPDMFKQKENKTENACLKLIKKFLKKFRVLSLW